MKLAKILEKTLGILAEIRTERTRQIRDCGHDPEHDDEYKCEEMVAAAAYYAMPVGVREWPMNGSGYGATLGQAIYPDWTQPKSSDRRTELIKAAALIVAEIERIDRAESTTAAPPERKALEDIAKMAEEAFCHDPMGQKALDDLAAQIRAKVDEVLS
jgi:hypothetical protein